MVKYGRGIIHITHQNVTGMHTVLSALLLNDTRHVQCFHKESNGMYTAMSALLLNKTHAMPSQGKSALIQFNHASWCASLTV